MRVRFAVGGVALVVVSGSGRPRPRGRTWTRTRPWLGVAFEVCVLLALTLSAALLMQRQFGISEPAQFVVLVVLGLIDGGAAVGPALAAARPSGTGVGRGALALGGVLAAALLVMAWQLRDPAARPLRRSLAW